MSPGYVHGKTLETPKGFLDHTKHQIRQLQEVEQRLADRIEYLKRVESLRRARVKAIPREKQIKKPRTPEQVIREGNKILAEIQAKYPQRPGIGAERMAEFIQEEDLHAEVVGRGYRKAAKERARLAQIPNSESYDIAA